MAVVIITVYFLLKYHIILKQSHICYFQRPRTFWFLSLCFHKGITGNLGWQLRLHLHTQSPTQKRLRTTFQFTVKFNSKRIK